MRGRNTMECPWFRIVWLLFVSTSARFIKDVENESPHDLGTCFYNGSWYKESEELPTRGLCLICHCFEGFTEPNAFTCSVIDCPWDDYHKRFPGCTPIYADRDCCPIGWECGTWNVRTLHRDYSLDVLMQEFRRYKLDILGVQETRWTGKDYGSRFPEQHLSKDSACDCEWRYLKHYEAKGCRPVYEEKPQGEKPSCACPWRFDCSLADEIHADDRVCSYKKQIYTVGSKINTTNPCETCSCVTDYFTQAASISCVSVECPSVFSTNPLPEGCHYVYKKGECCPVGVECPSRQDETIYNVPLCEYNGKMYYEGEQIYPEEDPCLICLCTNDWTGINSTSCRQHDCMLERDARKLRQGCIPIYHEKTCCPIDYHCADEELDFNSNLEPSFKSDDDEEEMCFFEGRYYSIGHVLDIKHPTNCVTCTCKTPPDFTCIHSSCPPPPNNDYVNCKAVYKPHSCCPDYTCTGKSNTVCPDPICNGTNCWLVKQDDGCSVCRCKSRCVPCPYMCQPENPENECSGCICQLNSTSITEKENEDIQSENDLKASEGSLQELAEECKKIKCSSDERCMLTEMRCFKQNCLPLPKCEKYSLGCGRRSCPSGCDEIGSYEDSCPICYCRKQFQEPQFKLTCKKHTCEENCVLSGRDENGCPLCQCPHISSNDKMCPVSRCVGYNCTLALNVEGCPECICQLPCKPRECPSGCELDLSDSSDNGLTCACQCRNSSIAIDYIYSKPIRDSCSPITCRGYNCSMSEDDSGCPMCSCKESCKPPTCLSGCIVEKDPPAGRCPGCVCKLSRSARDNTEKECPPPTCLGYNCSVLEGADGCQRCICESPCEESPACPSHCQLEIDVPHDRCRGCICSYSESLDLQSKGSENKTVSIHRGGGKVPESVLGGEYEVNAEEREDIEADFIPLPNKDLVPSVDKLYLIHDKDKPTLAAHSDQLFPHLASFYHEHIAGSYHTDDPVVNEQGTYLNAFERGGSQGKKNVHSQHSSDSSSISSKTHEENIKSGFENGDVLEEKNFEYEDFEEKAFEDEEKCIQKNCPPGQTCVLRRLQCIRMPCPVIPVCIDIEPVCPIPVCAIGCMVMKWDDEVCPSCFCGIIRGAQGRVCPRIPCLGRGCYNVIGDDGCPICKCDSICIPPKCSEGCKLETDAPEGRCPTCSCPPKVASTAAPRTSSTVRVPTKSTAASESSSLDSRKTVPRVTTRTINKPVIQTTVESFSRSSDVSSTAEHTRDGVMTTVTALRSTQSPTKETFAVDIDPSSELPTQQPVALITDPSTKKTTFFVEENSQTEKAKTDFTRPSMLWVKGFTQPAIRKQTTVTVLLPTTQTIQTEQSTLRTTAEVTETTIKGLLIPEHFSDVGVDQQSPVDEQFTVDHQSPVDEQFPVDHLSSVDEQFPVDHQSPVDEKFPVDHQSAVDEQLPVDQNSSVDEHFTADQQSSVDEQFPVEQQFPVDQQPPVDQHLSADQQFPVDQQLLVDQQIINPSVLNLKPPTPTTTTIEPVVQHIVKLMHSSTNAPTTISVELPSLKTTTTEKVSLSPQTLHTSGIPNAVTNDLSTKRTTTTVAPCATSSTSPSETDVQYPIKLKEPFFDAVEQTTKTTFPSPTETPTYENIDLSTIKKLVSQTTPIIQSLVSVQDITKRTTTTTTKRPTTTTTERPTTTTTKRSITNAVKRPITTTKRSTTTTTKATTTTTTKRPTTTTTERPTTTTTERPTTTTTERSITNAVKRPITTTKRPTTTTTKATTTTTTTTTTTEAPMTHFPIKFTDFPTVSPTHIAASAVKRPSSQHYPLKKPEEYHCPTPHCNGYNCSLLRGPDDCQRCVCDSPCAPCPSHCVKTKTSSVGRCPVCDCTVSQPVAEKKCPTVNCYGANCRKVKDSNGCLTCVCDPECVTPKCDPGCDILTDVPPGQCPGCVCKVTVVQAVVQKQRQCRPVACIGINCQEVRGSDGCPKCFCEPLCPPPKCDPGCEVQTDVAAGQCPTCVCADFPDDDDDEDESYCPNLFCADYGCREIPGPAGCPICLCDPICKTPICEPGCHIVTNRYHGRCPVCLCSAPLDDMTAVSNSSINANQLATTVGVVLEPVVAETELPSTEEPTTTAIPTTTEPPMTTTTEPPMTTTTELPTTTTLAPTTTTELTTTACPPPVCEGLRCRKVLSEDGCMTCKCRFKCPKPKCVGNCYAEVNPPPHRCPGCICPVRRRPTKPRTVRA